MSSSYRKILFLSLINTYCGITALIQSNTNYLITEQWKLLEYDFDLNLPINDKNFYNPQNVIATGLSVSNDRIFIATPRLFSGVAATVSTISKNHFDKSPLLQSYPNWSFHTAGLKQYNCSDLGLVSVYRLRIDSCNRLWALDAGVSRSLEDYEITCPPKILIFDLDTNQVVRRIDFPREVIRGETLFTNLIIDETTSKPGGNCDDVFVYISDTVEPGIVVYDSGNDLTWRVSHPAMYPDPDFAQSEIDGQKFVLMDGIVGLAFDERTGTVYFQPLATERLFSVSKQVLRAGPLANNEVLPVKLVGKKSSQGIGLTVSPFDSSIMFSPMTETAVASWNPNTNKQTIIAYDPVALQFVADMALPTNEPNSFYCISSKFHRFFLKNLNTNEYNTRIIKMNLPINTLTDIKSHNNNNNFNQNNNPIILQKPILPGISSQSAPTTYSQSYYNNNFGLSTISSNSLLERKPINQNQYFFGIDQPYQYEPVGLINRGITNPFTALNQGEEFPLKKSSSIFGAGGGSTTSSLSVPLSQSSSPTLITNGLHNHHYHHHQLHNRGATISSVLPSSGSHLQHSPENYLNRIPSTTFYNFNNNNKIRLPKSVNQTQNY